ncbi:hypothetical protein EW146_g446, partial [Bondarzewia mesenterica]
MVDTYAAQPQRTSSDIVLVSPDAWATRIPSLIRLVSRYSYPIFEGCWMLAAFVASIAIPAAVNPFIFDAMDKDRIDGNGPIFQARAISFALFVGVLIFFYVPLIVWKVFGQSRANALVKHWAEEDLRMKGPSVFIPTWKVSMPGVFTMNCKLKVSLPPNEKATYFHPAAYLPSWINGPADAQAAPAYYPGSYQNLGPGMPPNVGNVPLYSDEKHPFDDVKV